MADENRKTAAVDSGDVADFATFVVEYEPKLRHALTARFGRQRGREATVDTLAYAWEHWPRVSRARNPAGYLFRVGSRLASREAARARREVPLPAAATATAPMSGTDAPFDPRLPAALAQLSDRQRTAVLLVHGWHYSLPDAARTLGISQSALRTHIGRGLDRLRRELEVVDVQD